MSTAAHGFFITFEGGEGSGKTTQINRLKDSMEGLGRTVVTTREPGGTPEAEKIRTLLVDRDGGNWTPISETMLFFTARNMHVETLIKPALDKGDIVISDRFADSTRAYQCYGHGLPREKVEQLYELSLGDFAPDLTFILDIPPEEGLARAGKRLTEDQSKEDRFERLDIAFHQRLRDGYLEIAKAEPQRCAVIDATRSPDEIAAEILEMTKKRLG